MAASILTPEIPNTISIGGSQQQLDAMIAETTVPMLAIHVPRFDTTLTSSAEFRVTPGNVNFVVLQQSCAVVTFNSPLWSMVFSYPGLQ